MHSSSFFPFYTGMWCWWPRTTQSPCTTSTSKEVRIPCVFSTSLSSSGSCASLIIFTFWLCTSQVPQNNLADALSPTQAQTHEWELDHPIFLSLTDRWGTPTMDLFASQTNTNTLVFCSRGGCAPSSLTDTFTIRWNRGLVYLFPPLPLLYHVVAKLQRDNSNAILIAPWWPRQPCFAPLLRVAMDFLKLPSIPHLLSQSNGALLHPDPRSLALMAWRIYLS